MPIDESSPSASASCAHQTGDTQKRQSAGSGKLVVEGSSNKELLHNSRCVGVTAIDEHRAKNTGVGTRVGNRELSDEDLVGRVVRPLARVPLRREVDDEPGDLGAAGDPRVGPRIHADYACQVAAEDRIEVDLPSDREEAVIPQSIESG